MLISLTSFGQKKRTSSIILTQQETANLFTDSLKKQLGINYPIRSVYKCKDKSGIFYMVLTETNDNITTSSDTLHHNIKAFNFRQNKNELVKDWEMNDFIAKQVANKDEMEASIWFWTNYSGFADLDKDGLIDPILIYGTSGMNNTDDGRVKILTYYKGKKIAIRHQNGVLDFERNTKVDKTFYALPQAIQDHIKQIMEKMTTNNHAIFPSGWQKAMKEQKAYFDENKK
ncbi:MAG: hypothetical protein OT643_11885 [Bacteroidetes bacterium]|jgi:hypothetical protein|nr:hypothetical protein [Chitinophagales bacterium]MDA0199462.1 hypothetical protein [Bacteroidota bacterium]